MSLSQDHNSLFRRSDISDRLSLLQSLLDSKDLTAVQAIALLNNIRAELETPQTNRSAVYRRYAQVMESLRRQMPEVHEEVVHAWEARKGNLQAQAKPADNLIGSQPTLDQESTLESPFESPGGYRQPLENLTKHIQENVNLPESKEETAEGFEEGFEEEEAEHEELEEEHEPEEQLESEQEKDDEELEGKGEDDESEEHEEREERNETNGGADEEARDTAEHEEGKEEIEEVEENEEVEVETAESEPGEERQSDAKESSENGETDAGVAEESEGGDRMAAEAAEAAEHMESESELVEVPGEEEPPMEAGE